MASKLFCCVQNQRDYESQVDEGAHSLPAPAPMASRYPIMGLYLVPGDTTSCRRYFLLTIIVIGSVLTWLAPILGIFVIDPYIQLILAETQILTPKMDCLDHKISQGQECDRVINVDYTFFDVKNKDEWLAGTAPPEYEEVGPFSFNSREVRYNIEYNSDWTEVGYGYHQWQEFVAERSCPTCTLDRELTGINRGYLQFLSAGSGSMIDPESTVIYGLMPMVLFYVKQTMTQIITAILPAGTPQATIDATVLQQWIDCSPVIALNWPLPNPYLSELSPAPLPGPLELCAAISTLTGAPPAAFAVSGLTLNTVAAEAWAAAAIGSSNTTYADPLAQQFIQGFMTVPKATLLSILNSNPATGLLGGALSLISDTQWLLLQGYVASLVPTWGKTVLSGWVGSVGGGLVLTKPIHEWLYGYIDPILLEAAKTSTAGSENPEAYKLTPWLYEPFVALAFEKPDSPLEYFSETTGIDYNYSMLSWNSSHLGQYHPLIQQKLLATGKKQGSVPQEVKMYRGVAWNGKNMGILNVTGINEGTALGPRLDGSKPSTQFDSVLMRAMQTAYTGVKQKVKKVPVYRYSITNLSTDACNMTAFNTWASNADFDVAAYGTALPAIQSTTDPLYWWLHDNPEALRDHLASSGLAHDFKYYYGNLDFAKDRCATPDTADALYDMSLLTACPTMYTFPLFLGSSDELKNSTAQAAGYWDANVDAHSYYISVEPITGFAVEGHKTYQVNHLVSRTAHLYPTLTVVPGTGAPVGLDDYITVPIFWVKLWWEPTEKDAKMIIGLSQGQDAFYYLMTFTLPAIGWVLLLVGLGFSFLSKGGRERRRQLKEIGKSKAKSVELGKHDQDMAEALARKLRGSIGVVMPPSREHTQDEAPLDDIPTDESTQIPAFRSDLIPPLSDISLLSRRSRPGGVGSPGWDTLGIAPRKEDES